MPKVNRSVGVRFRLEGEDEYKQVLQNLNAGSRTLASEMTRLQAQYKGNTDSIEYLTEKSDILSRSLNNQQAKTAAAKEMFAAADKALADAIQALADAEGKSAEEIDKAKAQVGAAEREFEKYKTAVNLAEAAEYNLQHQIDETNKEIENHDNVMNNLIGTVQGLADQFGIQLPAGADKALNAMKGLSNGSVAAITAIGLALTAVIEGVKALYQNTVDVAAQVDTIITESIVTGIDTKTYQALQYAENLVDVSVGTMTGSLTKLMQNMRSARDGNEELAEAFGRLHIEIENGDGTLRDSYDVMMDIVDALGQMASGTERDAITTQLLGKSAQELNPLIEAGSAALAEFGEQAEAVGYILDEQQIAKLGEVDDAYQEVQLTIDALKKQMAADFAPAAKEAMELFRDVVEAAGKALKESGLIENLAMIITNLISIIRSIGQMLQQIPGFNQALGLLKVTLGAIAQFTAIIADAADLINSILHLDFHGAANAIGLGYGRGEANHWQTVYMTQSGTYDQYNEYYANKRGESTHAGYKYDTAIGQYYDEKTGNYITNPGWNAGGTDNWRGGLTWVGEAGPELVSLPRGSQVLSAQESAGVGGDTYVFEVNVKDLEDLQSLIRWAKNYRVTERMR